MRRTKKDKIEESFNRLTDSAFDFIINAIDLLNNDNKRAIIEFYLGVELFFKARLIGEHWSLVLEHPDNDSIQSFLQGDAKTVSLNTASNRIERIAGQKVNPKAIASFEIIRKHRNKMVHFYHDGLSSQKKQDQLYADLIQGYYHLYTLLNKDWKDLFNQFEDKTSSLHFKIHRLKDFLNEKFVNLQQHINNGKLKGNHYLSCPACSFDSFEILKSNDTIQNGVCLVCGHSENTVFTSCEDCGIDFNLFSGEQSCPKCKNDIDVYDIVCEVVTSDNYYDTVSATCSECGEYESVHQRSDGNGFFCVSCFETFEYIYQCEYCGSHSTTEREHSYLSGCEICDGIEGNSNYD